MGTSEEVRSFLPNQDLTSFAIDEVIKFFIINSKKEDSIVYIPSYNYAYLFNGHYELILDIISKTDILNKDMILVCINTDPNRGMHWILGIIHVKIKKIIILDSSLNKKSKQSIHFSKLIEIIQLCYNFENYTKNAQLTFSRKEWKLVYASDAIQQKSLFDCGLFVCIHAFCFVTDSCFFNPPIKEGRQWLHYNFNEYLEMKTEERDGEESHEKKLSIDDIEKITNDINVVISSKEIKFKPVQ